jgi:hypothetical protein
MTNSKLVNKKVLIPAAIVAVAIGLTIWGLSTAIAAVNQTMNSSMPGFTQLPTITGSVNAGQTVKNFIKDNLKVSFVQASEIAAKQIANGTIVGGHLGVVQGYLVYTFFAINAQSRTGFLTIVDAGNGHILYTSQGVSIGSFGPPLYGPFGPWRAAGFGGFWHWPFGPWAAHVLGGGLSQLEYPPGLPH